MLTKVLVLTTYFVVVIILGLLAKSRLKDGPADYFWPAGAWAPSCW